MSFAGNRILVLSPHPDDETFGCGGTIRQVATAGGQVDVLYMTRGENGVATEAPTTWAARRALARQRTKEARHACRILGVSTVKFLDGQDLSLATQPELHLDILAALQQGGYQSVFCPWPLDGHVDHAATFEFFLAALQRYRRELRIWLYEIWNPLQPNTLISIDAALEAKISAVRAHVSQLAVRDYLTEFLAMARYRGLCHGRGRHAEAFYVCTRQQFLDEIGLPWAECGGIAGASVARCRQASRLPAPHNVQAARGVAT